MSNSDLYSVSRSGFVRRNWQFERKLRHSTKDGTGLIVTAQKYLTHSKAWTFLATLIQNKKVEIANRFAYIWSPKSLASSAQRNSTFTNKKDSRLVGSPGLDNLEESAKNKVSDNLEPLMSKNQQDQGCLMLEKLQKADLDWQKQIREMYENYQVRKKQGPIIVNHKQRMQSPTWRRGQIRGDFNERAPEQQSALFEDLKRERKRLDEERQWERTRFDIRSPQFNQAWNSRNTVRKQFGQQVVCPAKKRAGRKIAKKTELESRREKQKENVQLEHPLYMMNIQESSAYSSDKYADQQHYQRQSPINYNYSRESIDKGNEEVARFGFAPGDGEEYQLIQDFNNNGNQQQSVDMLNYESNPAVTYNQNESSSQISLQIQQENQGQQSQQFKSKQNQQQTIPVASEPVNASLETTQPVLIGKKIFDGATDAVNHQKCAPTSTVQQQSSSKIPVLLSSERFQKADYSSAVNLSEGSLKADAPGLVATQKIMPASQSVKEQLKISPQPQKTQFSPIQVLSAPKSVNLTKSEEKFNPFLVKPTQLTVTLQDLASTSSKFNFDQPVKTFSHQVNSQSIDSSKLTSNPFGNLFKSPEKQLPVGLLRTPDFGQPTLNISSTSANMSLMPNPILATSSSPQFQNPNPGNNFSNSNNLTSFSAPLVFTSGGYFNQNQTLPQTGFFGQPMGSFNFGSKIQSLPINPLNFAWNQPDINQNNMAFSNTLTTSSGSSLNFQIKSYTPQTSSLFQNTAEASLMFGTGSSSNMVKNQGTGGRGKKGKEKERI